jgi:hypothetical protein
VVVVLLLALATACAGPAATEEGKKGKRRSGLVLTEVIRSPAAKSVVVPAAGASGFTPQVRLGYTEGDQWEPSMMTRGTRTPCRVKA